MVCITQNNIYSYLEHGHPQLSNLYKYPHPPQHNKPQSISSHLNKYKLSCKGEIL